MRNTYLSSGPARYSAETERRSIGVAVSNRKLNFSAGPAILPEEVLEEASHAILDFSQTGIGLLEHSHRGDSFGHIIESAVKGCRSIAKIPDNFHVLFLQGGATLQFAMVAANLLREEGVADYLETGSWSKKAVAEARIYGRVHISGSSSDSNFDRIPPQNSLRPSSNPDYVHYTSNNTIFGTQWKEEPPCSPNVPLVCDASSDIFSRKLDIEKYGLIYAGAQKNLGPAGVTLVIIRDDLISRVDRPLPKMLRYSTFAETNSLYNTPPVFGIFMMDRVFQWILREGGLDAIETRNNKKAQVIYDVIDESHFYQGTAQVDSRSVMNITFKTSTPELDKLFLFEAERNGFHNLKGHRSVGGMRASIYNAFPENGCKELAKFMQEFSAKRG